VAGGLVHWDDVEPYRLEHGHIDAWWQLLSRQAGSHGIAVNRIRVEPNRWSTPAHFHTAEEEIFYVLEGSGLSWQNGSVYEIGAGDCLVHRPRREAHSLRAGDDGLVFLVYANRVRADSAHMPRTGISAVGDAWTDATWGIGAAYEREAQVGEPEVGEPEERRSNIVNVSDLEPDDEGDRVVGATAGATLSGLHHRTLRPGKASVPAHCHSAEEEFFVMLTGTAVLELIPSPRPASDGVETERHELRPGHVVARPPGTRISHNIVGGDDGGTMLVYGTRDPNDIAYYPHSNKINFRGVGLIARLDALEYVDGETEFGG
jgi:uncharacterized cupin superfamily protein